MTDYQEQENNYPKAFLATGLIMGMLALLCWFIVFQAPPQQVDGIGGILVNYGTTDEGSGSDITSTEETSAAEKANHTKPTDVTPTPPTEKPTPTTATNEKVVTQDQEDAPEVATNAKKPTTNPPTQPTKPAPVKPQVVNQAALFHASKPSTGTGGGDGTTNTPGNQGSPNGSALSNNYGPGGSGEGLNMANWHFLDPPDVKNVNRLPGVVAIDFTVDEHGNVLEAHSNKQKTKASLDLVQGCLDAIKNSKFVSTKQASGNSRGEYVWRFKVD